MKGKAVCLALLLVLLPAYKAGAQNNLVVNGNFEGGYRVATVNHPQDMYGPDKIPTGWSPIETFFGTGPEYSAILASPNASAGGKEFRFIRIEYLVGSRSSDASGISQSLVVQKADECASLRLRLDVKLNSQDANLPAGGNLAPAFEWPLLVQLEYRTKTGQSQIWRHGWYLNPPGDGPRVLDPGTGLIPEFKDDLLPAGQYRKFDFDLLKELPQLDVLQILSVGGIGWGFDGAVDNIEIVCQPGVLRLLNQRFEVSAQWRVNANSALQKATAVRLSDRAGLFWFLSADNPEVMVKTFDVCDSSGVFWFFTGGMTNFEVAVRVKDRASGREKTYTNIAGQLYRTMQDTRSFDTCNFPWP